MQIKGEDPHKYKSTTQSDTAETIDLAEVVAKLASLKTEAAKQVADAVRDCTEKSVGTSKILGLVEVFERQISSIAPENPARPRLWELFHYPLGNPDAAISKELFDEIHKRDTGELATINRDPTPAMKALGVLLANLPKGNIVLLAPKEMKIGDKRQVDANVGINVPLDALQKKLRADQQQITGEAHLSSEMVATLKGAGFNITSVTPEQQTIAEGFPTVWSWNVEAKESGTWKRLFTRWCPTATQMPDNVLTAILKK